ncbi:MAG: TonB-dependent receptor [Prevotella sp.]|nr:TonB-dependent receptor [Prevotella sp.]
MNAMKELLKRFAATAAVMLGFCLAATAQGNISISGVVTDETGESIIGATIAVKGQSGAGAVTDFDGRFAMKVPSEKSILVVSYIGMNTREISVGKQRSLKIVMSEDNKQLNEVIVVGYGQQKKASVVGAITQTTGKVLERAAGISDIGAALTGNLPGVVTTATSGMPGEEEPQIVIRGSSSWNNSEPLVLVDGVERPMSAVDIASVESISVLKDASATAVYGVKGANGVILITTKRGQEGRARIQASANAIIKIPSKLPGKYDAYDALMLRNRAIEHELDLNPDSWANIRPQSFIENYRNQTTVEQQERYPNVDWQKTLFKSQTMSYNANVNVSGGTKFVKYFASIDFVNEGDLFKVFPNGRNYDSGYGYNRINVRSNLDFQITKTTTLKVNIAGSNGQQKSPYNNTLYSGASDWSLAQQWAGAYNIAPDVFLPVYSNGAWGYYPSGTNVTNSAENLSLGGTQKVTTTRINTDFTLDQDLSFITKGLQFHGMIAWDNVFVEWKRGVNDLYNNAQEMWIDPDTGERIYKQAYENANHFDFQQPVTWNIESGEVQNWSTQRNLNYQLQLNWARKFGDHDVTAMGLFSRQENAKGSVIPSYREDWAFRVTYNYAMRYFAEYNGAYNGSEKFSKDNRFAFFNSGAIGWTVSEEKWYKPVKKYVDMLKLRLSYGEIGDDNVGDRWLYMNQWAYVGSKENNNGTSLDINHGFSPYKWYRESSVGNPNVHWEKVKKWNFGIDYSLFGGLFVGGIDIFRDKRVDILVGGASRSVPSYFGQTAPTANLGEVKTHGYELTLRFNKVIRNGMRFWADLNMTHAENEVIVKDDQPLLPAYRKEAGYAIGQGRAFIDKGYLNTYDDIYGSPKHDVNDGQRLPGDYYIVDFNGDGVVDNTNDQVPYGYPSVPQNTYNATLGWEWKGLSCFVQFYGVTNVTRLVQLNSFPDHAYNTVYDQGSWWSKYDVGADVPVARWLTTPSNYSNGTRYYYDGSYVRLKNVEVAYTFTQPWIKKCGIESLRLYVSGNNLWMWTRMPDDREVNFSGTTGGSGAYPTVKRINFGIKIGF